MSQLFKSKLLAVLIALFAAVTLLCSGVAVRLGAYPYNGESNYFDGAVDHHHQSVLVFAVLAGASFLRQHSFSGSACWSVAPNKALKPTAPPPAGPRLSLAVTATRGCRFVLLKTVRTP
jgi:hypothetical protein